MTRKAKPESPPRKIATNTRGRPFEPGNPGKPTGARHKVTRAVEALLDGEAEAMTRKLIEAALGGDMAALKFCLDRIAPAGKGRPVAFSMPTVNGATDLMSALGALIEAVTSGELTPDEARNVGALLEIKLKAIEAVELERRISALEIARNGRY